MREGGLLEAIYEANPALSSAVTIPPGDDMAGIVVGGRTLLVAVDQLADGVHVDLHTTALDKVGRKAVTRNLSDVAAMAAEPVSAVVAASLPGDFGDERAKALFEAIRQTAEAYHCPLVGGDISIWDGPCLLSVTVLAQPAGIEPLTRMGAQPGDGLYVSGMLGNSFESEHHLDFEPRINLARQLAGDQATRPHAMIDLSDGIGADLPRICEHARIDADQLPIRPGTPEPAWRHALDDGEDYELLFAAPVTAFSNQSQFTDSPIQRIGTVQDQGGLMVQFATGSATPLADLGRGWEHGR